MVCLVKAMVFLVMYGCESWTVKKAEHSFWTMVSEKTLESPLDSKEIQPVHPKRDQSWVFIGRTDVEAEAPILWPPDAKSWLIWKDPDVRRNWGQDEKGTTKDEMVRWHHQLNGHGFGWTPGVGDGQGGLAFCSSWGCKESDITERLNWTELNAMAIFINTWVSTQTHSLAVSWEDLEAKACLEYRAQLEARSWFLAPFCNKRNHSPWRDGWF